MDIKDVKLKKGMNKEMVNLLIGEWITLEDNVYMGVHHKHNWKCKCGNVIEDRQFRSIKGQNATDCGCTKYQEAEDRYMYEVEKTGEYEYIKSYRYGDVLPNGNKIKQNIHLQVKHKYCGNIYEVETGSIINKNIGCSKCCKKYENSFAYHIEVELGEPLEKYWDFEKNKVNPYHIWKNSHEKIYLKCHREEINLLNGLVAKEYHDSYVLTCYDFTGGKRCSSCHRKTIHPYDSFGYHHFNKVMSWHPDNEISPFRVSRSNGNKYKFICETCGNIFDKRISMITHANQWCPECSMSEGEKKIAAWLRYNGIEYEYEKEYDGLVGVGGRNLSYDFYLAEYNLLIEYQGEQHEIYIPGFHESHSDFRIQQEHDKRKREYTENNKIKLLEIWYYDFDNIEEILQKEIINSNKLI